VAPHDLPATSGPEGTSQASIAGTAMKLHACITLATSQRLMIRMLDELRRSTRSNRYASFDTPAMESRKIEASGIIRGQCGFSEPLLVPTLEDYATGPLRRRVITIEAWANLHTVANAVSGPRWPAVDVHGFDYLQAWAGFDSGMVLGFSQMATSSAMHLLCALHYMGVELEGEMWRFARQKGFIDNWVPLHERLDEMRVATGD
jgi:hypothetical protein